MKLRGISAVVIRQFPKGISARPISRPIGGEMLLLAVLLLVFQVVLLLLVLVHAGAGRGHPGRPTV
jgi:hypothetical protein